MVPLAEIPHITLETMKSYDLNNPNVQMKQISSNNESFIMRY